MAEVLDLSDPEFTAQMQGLVEQAKKQASEEKASAKKEEEAKDVEEKALKAYQSLPQILRPFVSGIEAITRATGENTQILTKIDQATSESIEPLRALPGIVTDLQSLLEKKETLSRQMFDALHEELRSYKDDFLLESVHRPMIRDLITLFDDIYEIHRSMIAALQDFPESPIRHNRFEAIEIHLAHNLDFILEVLARLDVVPQPESAGKLDKKTQRAVGVEPAGDASEDFDIVRSVKRGFLWKDRIVRPEEVIIKKWSEGSLIALQPAK